MVKRKRRDPHAGGFRSSPLGLIRVLQRSGGWVYYRLEVRMLVGADVPMADLSEKKEKERTESLESERLEVEKELENMVHKKIEEK